MTESKSDFHGEIFKPNDPFVRFLSDRKEKLFYLKPSLGNSGDHLIELGDSELLANLGIKTTVDPRLAEVILWPGGNPTMYELSHAGWCEVLQAFPNAEFVVAPATFQMGHYDWPSLFRREGAKITGLFARDAESFQNLKQAGLPTTITIGLSHDPALKLRDTEWMTKHRAAATNEYVLLAFRDDKEASVSISKPLAAAIRYLPKSISNRISWRISQGARVKKFERIKRSLPPTDKAIQWDVSLAIFQAYVEGVRRARVVHTDRLHVMILAALLKKPVVAYQTTYGKLEAVYKNSLKDWADVSFQR